MILSFLCFLNLSLNSHLSILLKLLINMKVVYNAIILHLRKKSNIKMSIFMGSVYVLQITLLIQHTDGK